ncbi:gliding motility protein RemB [Flavobacterium tegetincola]|uniref:gliding motility protein RemB n=1 Tax=Flavobacterium tegetincola TaxID=150172 RepID=UPI00040E2000|nr:gliding motility protein RemB [Flavobacterium tegetincola]
MKKKLLILLFFTAYFVQGQESNVVLPQFENCKNLNPAATKECFYQQIQQLVFDNFKVPDLVARNNYKGIVNVLFEVDTVGVFKVQYVDAIYPELTVETKRVFSMLPKVKPALQNGKPAFVKYNLKIAIPLKNPQVEFQAKYESKVDSIKINREKVLTEFDSIVSKKFDNPIYKSALNIPFTHSYYAQFDSAINQVGSNNHTGSKPLTYNEVNAYYDFKAVNGKLMKNADSWLEKKLWNEHFFQFQGEDYWIIINPLLDVRVGAASGTVSSTFNNTRGLQVQAGLGDNLVLTTTVFESQGRFADYYNQYSNSIKPSGGNPAIIPGIGIAKEFKTDAYDFPSADANITYSPSKKINLQLGYGRNFIGDGYRSLLLGDAASPYPYFKINTTFWKIKYTNTYMWLKDVREEVTQERTYATKFMANHYLSWNVTKRWNLGFFESVVWANSNDRGFDANFINPIIFYRTVEFTSSARSGNAVLGLTTKYKFNNQVNFYGQFILDEFSLGDVKAQDQSWKNKYGYQLGLKYYNAFKIPNLLLQLEYNNIRPYVYSHSDPLTNYGHNNQSIGHAWGGNTRELIAAARYHKGRYFADAKVTYGIRGLDFNTATDSLNYGGNIYRDYDENRALDTGVKIGQGNKTSIVIADLQAGYLVNPSTNLKLFANYMYRRFDPKTETDLVKQSTTSWFTVGIRSDIFNWYFDY